MCHEERKDEKMNSDFCVAVHALVYLNHKACVLSSEALAENICTHPARVRRVLSTLRKAGLVETREGAVGGGYRFSGKPEKVTLAQVAQALSVHFVETSWRSGDVDMECLVASGMGSIMDGVFNDLNQRCADRLTEITIADLDQQIFGAVRRDGKED